MKYLFLVLLFISFQVKAAGSTNIKPIDVAPLKRVTVNVLHVTQQTSTTWYNEVTHNDCPNGSPEVWYKFFPINAPFTSMGVNFSHTPSKSVNGIFAFVCQETFWESDDYYKDLKAATLANPMVTCQGTSRSEKCSTVLERPPFILFIFKVPATAAVRSNQQFVTFRDATIYFNGTKIGDAYNNYNFNVQEGALFYTYEWNPANLPSNVNWYMQGENFNGQDTSSARNDSGNYGYFRCSNGTPPAVTPFSIAMVPILAGQTCTVSCKGDWDYNNPKINGIATWWSRYDSVTCAD